MGDHETRGDDMEKKAEKKISGWGIFGSKYEDAADLYDKAANFFKLAKNCEFVHHGPQFYHPLLPLLPCQDLPVDRGRNCDRGPIGG